MSANLLGNPHSDARSSQLSTKKVEDMRKRTLEFFHADPEYFDNVSGSGALGMDTMRSLTLALWEDGNWLMPDGIAFSRTVKSSRG